MCTRVELKPLCMQFIHLNITLYLFFIINRNALCYVWRPVGVSTGREVVLNINKMRKSRATSLLRLSESSSLIQSIKYKMVSDLAISCCSEICCCLQIATMHGGITFMSKLAVNCYKLEHQAVNQVFPKI